MATEPATEPTTEPTVTIQRLQSHSLDDTPSPESPKNAEELTANNESISHRRKRKLTELFFDEVVGKKMKCYQKWKLWATLCAIATFIAIAAIIIATALAVQHATSYKTKSEAIIAQNTMIKELFKSNISNETDHSNEVRRIFNTFDDDNDGLWNIDEFADHLNRATEKEAIFNKMDLDNDDILSFNEVFLAKSQESPAISSLFSHELIGKHYNYTGPKNGSLYWQYQANVFFNMYGAATKGYITRDIYYRYHARQKFKHTDLDSSGFIDFDEFSANTIDMNIIEWFKSPEISEWMNQTQDRCDCYCMQYDRRRFGSEVCEIASCDNSGCFAGDKRIFIERDNEVHNIWLKDIKVGDYVRSKYSGWTKIWWVKRLKRDEGIPHLKLYFGEEEYVTLTYNHLLYVNVLEDIYTKTAREVSVGDVLFVHEIESGSFVEKKVIDIKYTNEDMTYGPSTMDGTIVVNNVLASAYEGLYERTTEIHRATAIVRFISQYISEDLAVFVTDLNFYYIFDPLQRYNLGYIFFNSYSTSFITIASNHGYNCSNMGVLQN